MRGVVLRLAAAREGLADGHAATAAGARTWQHARLVERCGLGRVISPLLANLYLHYVLDLWAERWRRREAAGDMIIVRYADDCVPRMHRRKEVRNCVRDGGRSSGAGRQGQASNHRKLRRSKAGVVSVAEKAGLDPVRYGSERRARANR